jgi:hypothetical protein
MVSGWAGCSAARFHFHSGGINAASVRILLWRGAPQRLIPHGVFPSFRVARNNGVGQKVASAIDSLRGEL